VDQHNELKVGIVGTGLIGTSLAFLINKYVRSVKFRFSDVNRVNSVHFSQSFRNSEPVSSLTEFSECDYVFVASPPRFVAEIVIKLLENNRKTVIIDVSSVKSIILEDVLSNSSRPEYFFGGHPLAGGNCTGPEYASASVLENSNFVLCPHEASPIDLTEKLIAFLKSLSLKIVICSADEHDSILANTSHLNHLVAYNYAMTVAHEISSHHLSEENVNAFFSRSTIKSIRFASPNVDLWADIFIANKRSISEAVDSLINELQISKEIIAKSDITELKLLLAKAAAEASKIQENGSE